MEVANGVPMTLILLVPLKTVSQFGAQPGGGLAHALGRGASPSRTAP